jgi:Leucine-rich repeat (LRR) protein
MQTILNNSFANLPSNITGLFLHHIKVETIESQAFVGCEHLQYLTLESNQLTSLPQNVFEPLRNIKGINLSHNQLAKFSLDVFANNQNLEKVYLHDNKMTVLVPIQHKGEFSIKELQLQDNDLKNISEVCKFQKLETLILAGNRNLEFATFKFSCWPELRKLYLYDTNLKRLNYEYRLFIGLNKLKLLDLSENNLDMLCVGNFPALLELEQLGVDRNKLKTMNAQDLKSKFPKLNRIDIENNPWDCNNFDNMKTIFKALKINIHFDQSPTCDKSTKTNEFELISCPISQIEIPDEKIRAPFTNNSLFIFALQMVLTVILFIVDVLMSVYFYVIK